jgi:POT family proton-dependent oligopeptide transporter
MGAIIADSKWGRYKTITVFCLVYFIGLIIIFLTSLPSSLAHNLGYSGWILGATVVALGTGGIKANVSPLIADQYRRSQPFVSTNPLGQRVIVDPNITITRIYNLFYWSANIGSLSSVLTTLSERNVGFWLAFLLPSVVFLLTPIILVLSRKMYYVVPPRGSIMIEVWKCSMMVLAAGWSRRREDWWKFAKPSYYKSRLPELSMAERKRYDRITWDDTFVDEVQRTLRASQIFLFFPVSSSSVRN